MRGRPIGRPLFLQFYVYATGYPATLKLKLAWFWVVPSGFCA